jgi:hypothetical protein
MKDLHNTTDHPVSIRSARYLGSFPRLRTASWVVIGQDGGQSIDLGEQTLFVFSDTLLAPFNEVHGEYAHAPFATPFGDRGIFLANCAGLANSRESLSQTVTGMHYYVDEMGFPCEILKPTPEEREQKIRFWPEHGIYIDGQVYLYYLGIQTTDHDSIWGFCNVGVGLATLDLQTGECDRIYHEGDWCLWQINSDDFHFGVQVLTVNEHVYVFGSRQDGFGAQAVVGRVEASRITDPAAYEYLHLPKREWQPDLEGTGGLAYSGSEYSISYNPYLGKYVMFYVEGSKKTVKMRTADDLVGPYSSPKRVGKVPCESTSELAYLAFEHPEFRMNDGEKVYISYCQPRFTPNALLEVRFR